MALHLITKFHRHNCLLAAAHLTCGRASTPTNEWAPVPTSIATNSRSGTETENATGTSQTALAIMRVVESLRALLTRYTGPVDRWSDKIIQTTICLAKSTHPIITKDPPQDLIRQLFLAPTLLVQLQLLDPVLAGITMIRRVQIPEATTTNNTIVDKCTPSGYRQSNRGPPKTPLILCMRMDDRGQPRLAVAATTQYRNKSILRWSPESEAGMTWTSIAKTTSEGLGDCTRRAGCRTTGAPSGTSENANPDLASMDMKTEDDLRDNIIVRRKPAPLLLHPPVCYSISCARSSSSRPALLCRTKISSLTCVIDMYTHFCQSFQVLPIVFNYAIHSGPSLPTLSSLLSRHTHQRNIYDNRQYVKSIDVGLLTSLVSRRKISERARRYHGGSSILSLPVAPGERLQNGQKGTESPKAQIRCLFAP